MRHQKKGGYSQDLFVSFPEARAVCSLGLGKKLDPEPDRECASFPRDFAPDISASKSGYGAYTDGESWDPVLRAKMTVSIRWPGILLGQQIDSP